MFRTEAAEAEAAGRGIVSPRPTPKSTRLQVLPAAPFKGRSKN